MDGLTGITLYRGARGVKVLWLVVSYVEVDPVLIRDGNSPDSLSTFIPWYRDNISMASGSVGAGTKFGLDQI
jgi:hypothetical protein